MSTFSLKICAQLDAARQLREKQVTQSLAQLRRVYQSLSEAYNSSVVVPNVAPADATPDLFLYTAEAAAQIGDWDIVRQCLDILVARHPTTTPLTCRMLFCQCMLHTNEATGRVGEQLVDKTLTAVAKALKGINLALQEKDRLGHLVVRGSEHCWNAIRCLYASGTLTILLPTLKEINAAFEAVQYKHWGSRVTWLLRQAVAEVAGGKDAKPTVLSAVSLCDKGGLDHLKHPLKRAQMAMKLEPTKGSAAGLLRGVAACQAVYSRLGDEKEQAADLQLAYQDLGASTLVGASLGKRVAKPAPVKEENPKEAAKGKGATPVPPSETEGRDREEVFAELGLLAALRPLPPLAEDPSSDDTPERGQRHRLFAVYTGAVHFCDESGGADLNKDHFASAAGSELYQTAVDNMLPAIAYDTSRKASKSTSLRARVFAEYTAAVLAVRHCGGYDVQRERYANRCTPAMANQILSGVRALVKALESAVRTNDIHLTQQGCILVWNLSLPLLNPDRRGAVSKCLQSALHSLEAMGSNLHRLKAQILCELAYCDVADEYLAKAKARVAQALAEDYVVDEEESTLYGLPRPLDRYLIPLQQKLELKADLYYVPDASSAEGEIEKERVSREEVILLLDRAAETKSAGSLLHMLRSAFKLLAETEPPLDWVAPAEDPAPPPPDPKGGKKRKSITEEEAPPRPTDAAEESRRRDVLRARAALWANLLSTAWKKPHPKLAQLVRETAPMLLRRPWGHHAERQLRIDQVQVCLTCADTYRVELQQKGHSLGQRVFRSAAGDLLELSESLALRTEVLRTHDAINTQFTLALGLAPALLSQGDSWLVANVAVAFLNWHMPLVAARDFVCSYTHELQIQKDAATGLLAAAVGAGMVVSSVTPDTHADLAGLREGMRVAFINGEPVNTAEAYEGALRDSKKLVVNVTATSPLQVPLREVLDKLLGVLSLPEMGLLPQCSAYEAGLLALAGRAVALCSLQEYIASKLPLGTPEAELMAADVSSFPHPDPASPLLKQAEETCDRILQALPAPMYGKFLYFLLAATRRLLGAPGKLPDVPIKPEYGAPQEKVLAALELLKHISGAEKDKVLKDALADLASDPNVELAARLAERALSDTGFPKHAVQICQVAKDLEGRGELGVQSLTLSKHALDSAPAGDGKKNPPKDKGGAAAAKRVSVSPDAVEKIPPPPPGETHFTWYSHVLQHSGCAMLGLIDPRTQEKTTQTELRRRALDDFSVAAAFALKGRAEERPGNMLRALKLYHMAAQPFAGAVVTRAVMQASLIDMVHRCIPGLRVAELEEADVTVVLDLHLILIQACRDRADYDRGLSVMKQAMELLPRTHHKPLWEADVQFRCKMGQSAVKIRDKLRAVKGYDAPTQARAWVMFSRCIDNEADQQHALQQAVETLSEEPEAQAAALTRLAVWMFTHRRPSAECKEVLLYAADLIENSMDRGESSGGDDGRSLKDTRSQGSLGASHMLKSTNFSEKSTMRASGNMTKSGGTTVAADARVEGPTVQQLLNLGIIFTHIALLGGARHHAFFMNLQLAVMHFGQTVVLTQRELERRGEPAPQFIAPDDLTKWAAWELPADVAEYLSTCRPDARLLCAGTVEDPHYVHSVLCTLSHALEEHNLPLQQLAVLGVEDVLLHFMSMHHVARKHMASRNLQERVVCLQQLSLEAAASAAQGKAVLGELTEGTRRELLEDLREVLLNPPVAASHEVTSGVELVEAGSPAVYAAWIAESRVLLRSGMYGHAKVLLEEALVHAEAWRHRKQMAICRVLLAEVALQEGRLRVAGELIADTVEDSKAATVLGVDTIISVLLLRTRLLLQEGASQEAVLAVTHTAEAALSCPDDPSQGAQFDPYKGRFLHSFVSLLVSHYDAQVGNTSLPSAVMSFAKAGLQRASQYLGSRGPAAARLLLLMCRVHEKTLLETPIVKDAVRLRDLRMLLHDQLQLLRACISTCTAFAANTAPYPAELRHMRIVQPIATLMCEAQVLLARNTLRRHTIIALLRRQHVLSPAPARGTCDGTDPDSLQVRGFLDSDIGVRFMTMTRKQRNTRTRLRERERRRAQRLRELEGEWEAPPSARESGSANEAPPDDTEPLPDPVPTDEEREAWQAQVLQEYPSDNGSDTSSSDSETEAAAADRVALHIDGTENDYSVTPIDAHAICDTALAGANPGTPGHSHASLATGECLRAAVENTLIAAKARQQGRRGEDLVPSPTAVDDLWTQAEPEVEATPDPAEADKAKGKKGKAAEEDVAPPPPKEDLEGANGSDRGLLAKKHLTDALQGFMSCDMWSQAEDAAHELSRVCVTTGEITRAAKYVALAQSLAASSFSLKVFLQAAHPQNREKLLFQRLEELRSSAPGAPLGARYTTLAQTAFDTSLLYRCLRPWKSQDPALPTVPPNTSILVLHIGKRRQHVYSVHLKAGRPPLVGRSPLPLDELEALRAASKQLEADKAGLLGGDVAQEGSRDAIAAQHAGVLQLMQDLLHPVVAKHAGTLADSVVLCASHELQQFPLECLGIFADAKQIQRDVSPFHYEARLETTEGVPKAKVDNLRYVVDPFDETDGALLTALLGDKPKPAWDGATGTTVSEVLVPLSAPQVLGQLRSATNLAVCLSAGRLCSVVNADDVSSLDLSGLKCLLLADRCLHPKSLRRTTRADSKKPEALQALESCVPIALLLLGRGAPGLLANLGAVSLEAASADMRTVLGAYEKGAGVAEALHAARKASANPPPAEAGLGPLMVSWERCCMVAWGLP